MTENQIKQLDFLRSLEQRETLSLIRDITCKCKTCGVEVDCHAATTAISFIYKHQGHYTWVTAGSGYNPLTRY